jgi:hypothetical protein
LGFGTERVTGQRLTPSLDRLVDVAGEADVSRELARLLADLVAVLLRMAGVVDLSVTSAIAVDGV